MNLAAGTYRLGPDDGALTVRTGRSGAAAKAGHDLVIDVTSWKATLQVGDDTSIELTADPTSLRVREGKGGMQALGDDDMANIEKTIDDEVLEGQTIAFHSTVVRAAEGAFAVEGELTLGDTTRPIAFDVAIDGDRISATAVVTQTDFGIKPYSTLFGALKVADDVEVALDAALPQSR